MDLNPQDLSRRDRLGKSPRNKIDIDVLKFHRGSQTQPALYDSGQDLVTDGQGLVLVACGTKGLPLQQTMMIRPQRNRVSARKKYQIEAPPL